MTTKPSAPKQPQQQPGAREPAPTDRLIHRLLGGPEETGTRRTQRAVPVMVERPKSAGVRSDFPFSIFKSER